MREQDSEIEAKLQELEKMEHHTSNNTRADIIYYLGRLGDYTQLGTIKAIEERQEELNNYKSLGTPEDIGEKQTELKEVRKKLEI